jgi:hypothetical protein
METASQAPTFEWTPALTPAPPLPADTSLALPSVFASHMVVPAGVEFAIWGLARTGTGPVTVTINGLSVDANLESDGRWYVTLPAMNASKAPTAVNISSAEALIQLEDVVVGDVYICMGASNMAMPLERAAEGPEALELAAKLGDRLRILNVGQRPCCEEPQDNLTAEAPWQRVWSEGPTGGFSALCYFFGAEQLSARPDLPVGLIQVTAVDSQSWHWAPPHSVATCHKPSDVADDIVGIYWNSMLHPLTALRGPRALLFELEGDGCVSIDMVSQLQKISATRRQGGSENEKPAVLGAQYSCTAPASFTAANYDYQQDFLQLHRSGVVVTSDLCTPAAQGCGAHSPFKHDEAKRFAIRAEQLIRQRSHVPASFPKLVHVFVDMYNESWGSFHFGTVSTVPCPWCNWGMRLVFDQKVDLRPDFQGFKGYLGHINGFQLYPNMSPGLEYLPLTMQFSGVGGYTVQLNVTMKMGELWPGNERVKSPWPGKLQYGEGPFPVMPLVSSATGEPVPQFSLEVPLGDGKEDFEKLQLADKLLEDVAPAA